MTAVLLLVAFAAPDNPPTLLARMAKLPVPPNSPVVRGMLLGHALAPGGWPAVRAVLTNPDVHFAVRLNGLKMLPDLRAAAPDVLTDAERAAVYKSLLDQDDLIDLVADQLRAAADWSYTPAVLAAYDGADTAVARRAVVMYALRCPGPAAAVFVGKVQAADPKLLAAAEERLKLADAEPPAKK